MNYCERRRVVVTTGINLDTHMQLGYPLKEPKPPYINVSNYGYFLQFGQEGEDGSVYPVAIVEMLDGTLRSVSLSSIQFDDKR